MAERIATLDLVSDGRVDFGTGESSSEAELGGFLIHRDDKRAQWDEALDAVTRMFVEEPFAGYDGRCLSMPPRNVVPKPFQKPHPPLWVACSRRETIHLAATKGIGALSFSFIEPAEAKAWVDDYYATLASEECVPGGFAVNPNLAVVLPLMCHDDEETAIERGLDGGHFFGYSLAHYYVFGEHQPGITNVWDEFQENRVAVRVRPRRGRPDRPAAGAQLIEQGPRVAPGRHRHARADPPARAGATQDAGVDQVIFVSQAGTQPPRAHLRVDGAVRPDSDARVPRRGRGCPRRPSGAPRSGSAGVAGPPGACARRHHPP